MRRQVKPFVTEYRGGARRTKDSGGDLQAETPRHRAFDEAQRFFQPDPSESGASQTDYSEDSYDAAMRAADALFSASVKPVARAQSAAEPETRQPWPERSSPPTEERSLAVPAALVAAGVAPSVEASPAKSENGPPRRILQAIEPAAEDRFAALEAARAPKRRGRKPGSKNKPKVVTNDDWQGAPVVPPKVSARAVTVPVVKPVAIRTAFANDDRPDLAFAEGEVADDRTDGSTVPSKSRNDRFIRKRDGLRPGERWKRRLPKAAW